jgi:DNA-binding MarR family transcriptional regulator
MAKTATSPIRTPELASQLRLAVLRLARLLRQHAPVDVTPSQLSALTSVVREGRVTLSQLAEIERVKPPTVTRIVDALGQRNLVTRVVDDEDRRVAWVAATTEGRALVDTIRRRRDAYLAEHLRNLSDDDRELLARAAVLLERLLEDPEP